MPINVVLEQLPLGITLSSVQKGQEVSIQPFGTATSEDGERLIAYLGFANEFLPRTPVGEFAIQPSMVDNLIAVVGRDKSATVWINECGLVTSASLSKTLDPGDPVHIDDIVDYHEVRFDGVQVPDDAGVLAIVSCYWRKGVLFDFAPLAPSGGQTRTYSVWKELAQIFARLTHQQRLALSDEDWESLFQRRWFPFAALGDSLNGKLIGAVRASWSLTEVLEEVDSVVASLSPGMLVAWRENAVLSSHCELLERALERHRAADYFSSCSILVPRIEGILRALSDRVEEDAEKSQKSLSGVAFKHFGGNELSLLLPARFCEYLRRVYFANFSNVDDILPLGRNTLAHGVVPSSSFDQEASLLGILIVHQLYYIIGASRFA